MKVLIFALVALLASSGKAGDSITVGIDNRDAGTVLEWHSQMNLPLAGTLPQYIIEWSPDLKNWQMLEAPIAGGISVSDEVVRHAIARPPANGFYRVHADVAVADGEKYPDGIYGYASEFSRNLQAIGQITLEDFVSRYTPTNEYRQSISFDPTTARYWDQFNMDPAVYNATNSTDKRVTDFRLNADEFAIFKTNGFVISQRLGSYSFADAFYKVFIDDLPVFVSADALLHAWHRDYASILAEVEESFLTARLGELLTNMSAQIPALHADAAGTPLEQGVLDADYYLAVAKSLLAGTNDPGQLNQSAQINQAIAAVQSLSPQDFQLFGEVRKIDFSQFTVRGHYADNPFLQNYFRAMIWCGLIDFQFKGTNAQSLREFSGATALTLLLNRSDSLDKWSEFDRVIRNFVGFADCMTLGQLSDLLAASNFAAPFDQLPHVYEEFWRGALGAQNIRSGYVYSPFGPDQYKMPRSFALMPQRFIVDSWAFSKVVFDDIIWDSNGIPEIGDKIERRVPSALDIAFLALGNDQVVPEIAARIADPNGRKWRDGLPYQHNLAAVRASIDAQGSEYWTSNIYASWLNCLRALSEPTTDAHFSEAFQTRAWALNSANTELASWTELRHDTILYAKQSSTAMMLCEYPFAYVEPRPEFWARLADISARTRTLLQEVPEVGAKYVDSGGYTFTYPAAQLKTNWTALYERFEAAARMLQSIAEKEIDHADLDGDQVEFLQNIVEQHTSYTSGERSYGGWYPQLYYKPLEHTLELGVHEGSDMWSPVVTDVHTDPADDYTGDPGCILHEAVGNVNMAFIVVDCDDGMPIMYAGPVMSHFEFELGPSTRQTDEQWREVIKQNQQPAPPSWTKSFLVPGLYTPPEPSAYY